MEEVIPGIYQHYKGEFYHVLGTTVHTETGEELVLYRSVTFTEKDNKLWVRPKQTFLEDVVVEGESIPRFKFTMR